MTQEQQLQLFQQLQQLQTQYAQQQHQQSSLEGPFLQHILNTDTVCHALMKHPEMATELAQYLPDGTASDVESVCEHIRSAQFQSAVSMFNHALMTGEIQPFLESFGLPRATGAGPISWLMLLLSLFLSSHHCKSACASNEMNGLISLTFVPTLLHHRCRNFPA